MTSASENPVEIKEQYADGAITVEQEFHDIFQREVGYISINGVRVRRRDLKHDKLPGFQESSEQFRDLSFGSSEIAFLEAALMRYAIGHHSLFLGPPGFGKSRMLKFMAFLLNIPFFRVQCTRKMDVTNQFLWQYVKDNGSFRGRLGPLPEAMQQGAMLLVDELPILSHMSARLF